MSNGIWSSAEKRGAGKEASPWVWVGMAISEASDMEMVVNRYGGPEDRWWWDMVMVVFMGAGFHDEGGYGGF